VTAADYYDVPGNHDAYSDATFRYYLANSVQGRATGKTQVSFVRALPTGEKYHFLGINTAGNTGSPFSILSPYGDYAGLDPDELTYISSEMDSHNSAELTLVFGHHPLFDTGDTQDTWVSEGLSAFLTHMNLNTGAFYGFGHTHETSEALHIPNLQPYPGFYYFNVASLGKSSSNQYDIMAIDCNGLSAKTKTIKSWPAVLITAPLDAKLGGTNPYADPVPAVTSNPIRALVFDQNTVLSVQYRIDSGTVWYNMSKATGNASLWQGVWDASSQTAGAHTIEVKATSTSGTSNDVITVNVERTAPLPGFGVSMAVGKYVSGQFSQTTTLTRGNTVVFRATATDSLGAPIAGATVTLSITGPNGTTSTNKSIITGATNASGQADATWATTAPNKRGAGGTLKGTYIYKITGVSASGYTWDGNQSQGSFVLN